MTDENEQKVIEEEFSQSWGWMEQYFANLSSKEDWDWIKPICGLIGELRRQGYDRQFRAGQSMYLFVLSRSRHHGLRRGMSYIKFEAIRGGHMGITCRTDVDTVTEFEVERVEITPEIEALLTRLLAQPISYPPTPAHNDG